MPVLPCCALPVRNACCALQTCSPGRFVAPAGGLEFAIDLEQPPHLFVVRKQQRRGIDTAAPGALTLLAVYYILDRWGSTN